VDVVFSMTTSNNEVIKAPLSVNTSDGRICRAQGPTKKREWLTRLCKIAMAYAWTSWHVLGHLAS
jgi:hypothetical protein